MGTNSEEFVEMVCSSLAEMLSRFRSLTFTEDGEEQMRKGMNTKHAGGRKTVSAGREIVKAPSMKGEMVKSTWGSQLWWGKKNGGKEESPADSTRMSRYRSPRIRDDDSEKWKTVDSEYLLPGWIEWISSQREALRWPGNSGKIGKESEIPQPALRTSRESGLRQRNILNGIWKLCSFFREPTILNREISDFAIVSTQSKDMPNERLCFQRLNESPIKRSSAPIFPKLRPSHSTDEYGKICMVGSATVM
jgi:hypothetical protein